MNLETLKLLTSWTKRTDYILRLERNKLGIGDSGELDRSQKANVRQLSDTMLQSQLEFLVRGRFVDMGAGRRASKIESREGNARLLRGKTRRPKKWYSRVFWGRINSLQGALGFKMMEDAIRAVKKPLEDDNYRPSVQSKL